MGRLGFSFIATVMLFVYFDIFGSIARGVITTGFKQDRK